MARSIVTCSICNSKFDKNTTEWVKTGAYTYAHKSCIEQQDFKKTPEERDYDLLIRYVNKQFNTDTISEKMRRQISDYHKTYNYTYSGMLKTLMYWFEVQKKNVADCHFSLGIIPYIYDDAYRFYYNIYETNCLNADIEIKKLYNIRREVVIKAPRGGGQKVKEFNIDKGDLNG